MDFAAIMAEERANAGLAVPRSHAGKPPSPSSTKGKKSSTARAKAWKERTAREIGSPSTASIRWELRRERENLEAKDKAKDKAKAKAKAKAKKGMSAKARAEHASFMEGLGREAVSRGYMPDLSAIDKIREADGADGDDDGKAAAAAGPAAGSAAAGPAAAGPAPPPSSSRKKRGDKGAAHVDLSKATGRRVYTARYLYGLYPPLALPPRPRLDWSPGGPWGVGPEDGGLWYAPDFVSAREADALVRQCYTARADMWTTLRTSGRRLQEWGGRVRPESDGGTVPEPTPPWVAAVCAAVVESGVFPADAPPNHVLLNEYQGGQGIMPHEDGPLYAPTVAILSLAAPCVLDFKRKPDRHAGGPTYHRGRCAGCKKVHAPSEPCATALPGAPDWEDGPVAVVLRPASLVVFGGDAYTQRLHGIDGGPGGGVVPPHAANCAAARVAPGDVLARGRRARVSLTIRRVLTMRGAPPGEAGVGAGTAPWAPPSNKDGTGNAADDPAQMTAALHPYGDAKAHANSAIRIGQPHDPNRRCGHCGQKGARARCGRCRQAWYCGAACQRKAWKAHKKDCGVFARMRGGWPGASKGGGGDGGGGGDSKEGPKDPSKIIKRLQVKKNAHGRRRGGQF